MPSSKELFFERLIVSGWPRNLAEFSPRAALTRQVTIDGTSYKDAFLIKHDVTLEAISLHPLAREVVGIFGSGAGGTCRWAMTVNGFQTGEFTTTDEDSATIRIKLGEPRLDRTLSIHAFPEDSPADVPCLMAPLQQFKTSGRTYTRTPT